MAISSSFNDWLADQGLAEIDDGSTQSYFSVHYTAWLTEVFNTTEVREWLLENHGIALDAAITVKLNQNDSNLEASPYIEVAGQIYDVFQDFFDNRTDVDLKTGKVLQERWYSDLFTFGDANQAPVANEDRWFVSDDTVAVLGSNAVLANDFDPDSDPLAITAINGEVADINGIITANTDSGRTIVYDTNTNKFTLTIAGITPEELGDSGLLAEEDAFSYTIDDGNGGTATGTVNLTLVDTKEDNSSTTKDNLDLGQYTAYYQTANGEDPGEAFSFINAKGGDDTVVGTDGNDILIGGDNNDSLVGGEGDDFLDGSAGANVLVGGSDSDILIFRDQNTTENGQDGFDVLQFSSGTAFNATAANLSGMTNLEMINLENGAADSFGQNGGVSQANRLSIQEVLDMTDADDTLFIVGDATADAVNLNTGFALVGGGPVSIDGVSYNLYSGTNVNGTANLYIDIDITNISFG